ncbi:hypothetical protein ABG768_015740 [Culter alburnus]|uniref:Uncharacterized protein n=1 Tax=Culter alburnus TaxID=194366 RepID=A0AAW1Z3B0_CULAL
MEVIGAIDEFPCDAFGLQLVLLLGEDGSVFAYEDESLHLVAKSLRDLFQCEMVFPGIKTFKIGEYFDEPTEEEYREMMESDEVKAIKKQHKDFRESLEHDLLNIMKEIAQSRNINIIFGLSNLKVHMKSKLTLFTLLVHITSLVVNNSSMQVKTQKKIVCRGNLQSKSEKLLLVWNGVPSLMTSV